LFKLIVRYIEPSSEQVFMTNFMYSFKNLL